jgi:hypothetical protein
LPHDLVPASNPEDSMIALSSFVPLTTLLGLALPFFHPHVPKAIVLHGAGGTATLTWFTVPYNPEQVKTLANGREWHLGFAALEVGMPLASGDVRVPPAKYKLNVLRDQQGEFSALTLVPWDLFQADRGRNPDADKVAAIKKELAAKGIPERLELPVRATDEPEAEHLEFTLLTRGYEAEGRFSAGPKGGASFSLFADFGDLHRRVDLVETFPAGKGTDK